MPPSWGELSIAAKRPVFSRPRRRVENSTGKREIMVVAGGVGSRMESTPWITPFVANCRFRVNSERRRVKEGERNEQY